MHACGAVVGISILIIIVGAIGVGATAGSPAQGFFGAAVATGLLAFVGSLIVGSIFLLQVRVRVRRLRRSRVSQRADVRPIVDAVRDSARRHWWAAAAACAVTASAWGLLSTTCRPPDCSQDGAVLVGELSMAAIGGLLAAATFVRLAFRASASYWNAVIDDLRSADRELQPGPKDRKSMPRLVPRERLGEMRASRNVGWLLVATLVTLTGAVAGLAAWRECAVDCALPTDGVDRILMALGLALASLSAAVIVLAARRQWTYQDALLQDVLDPYGDI